MFETILDNDRVSLIHGDCLDYLKSLPNKCVDLVLTSSPYENARTYGIDFKLKGDDFVQWAVERFIECHRVSKGLTAWVIEGKTRKFSWSGTPVLIMAELLKRGINLRKPVAFRRVGIAGSGGPDWWRNDWEFVICATHGKLPWSDNTATGHIPKYAVGGEMSYRNADGSKKNERHRNAAGKNQWGHSIASGATVVDGGGVVRSRGKRPSHKVRLGTGQNLKDGCYRQPVLANPGNVIEGGDMVRCNVGGGVMGSKLAHENEAPYPETLCDPFIKCFCPENGIVLDPFVGSGTTLASALKNGRNAIGVDCRMSQIELCLRRIEECGVVL